MRFVISELDLVYLFGITIGAIFVALFFVGHYPMDDAINITHAMMVMNP
jgi:hypothetical protein